MGSTVWSGDLESVMYGEKLMCGQHCMERRRGECHGEKLMSGCWETSTRMDTGIKGGTDSLFWTCGARGRGMENNVRREGKVDQEQDGWTL